MYDTSFVKYLVLTSNVFKALQIVK